MSATGFITSANSEFESDAKIAYGIWAHRTGTTTPYEFTSTDEMLAFREIVQYVYSEGREDALSEEPECEDCQGPLVCLKCNPDPDCPTCGQLMGCEDCDEKRVKARAAAKALATLRFPDESGAWAI